MDNNGDDINRVIALKILLNSEIEKCIEAINQHHTYAEVRIIYTRIKELEDTLNILQQNFLS